MRCEAKAETLDGEITLAENHGHNSDEAAVQIRAIKDNIKSSALLSSNEQAKTVVATAVGVSFYLELTSFYFISGRK